MRENAIREQQAVEFVEVRHINGPKNLSDMFTKEDKDDKHFISCRDATMAYPTEHDTTLSQTSATKGGVRNNTLFHVDEYQENSVISDARTIGPSGHSIT